MNVMIRKRKSKPKKKIIIGKVRNGELVDIKENGRNFVLLSIGGRNGVVMILEKVLSQALRGSFKHQELLLNYILGKPVERLKLDALVDRENQPVSNTVFQIIADNVRLDKLAKDVEAAEGVDEERIKAMENLLNNEGGDETTAK